MKRLVVLGVLAALVTASPAVPAAARKKKPKPAAPAAVEQKLFLRQDSESCQTPHTFLSVTDGPDLSCLYHDAGAPYEVANQVQPITTAVWPVDDDTAFVLDPTKPLRGEITIRGGDTPAGPFSLGEARFDLVVLGEVGGEIREIGSITETWTTSPGDVRVVELNLPIDPALAGRPVYAFRIETTLRGASIGPHTIELDDPASFVVVPKVVTQ